MTSVYVNVIEPASRRFAQSAGYAFVSVVAGLLLTAIITNPVLP